MIPIIYEKTETAFTSNGLGRLRDCISCTVKEERNGLFECDFEYPITGANYELIQLGRIIGVTHDESETIEPFDIVSFSKPINGVVSFHAVHISYRLSAVTVSGQNINSLADALALLANATPSNPFTYYTDKTSSAYMAAADGLPHSVRQMLGGIEGSILDTYGGEYKFERFRVSLLSERGKVKPFTVRYGVNLLEYNDETDASATFTSCIPYWTDGTTSVIGNKVTSGGGSFDGRERCVPYDLSEKFETAPTRTQLQNMAASEMNRLQVWLPAQTISIDFVRLSDIGEFSAFESLYTCNLCDSITVMFPDYGTSGLFKIVSTTWNVLSDRYDGMELGTLATTLGDVFDNASLSKQDISGYLPDLSELVKVVEYHATYNISASGRTNLTAAQMGASTPSGYTPIGVAYYNTGSQYVFPLRVDGTATGSTQMLALKNTSTNAINSANAYIKVIYVKNEYI